MSDSVVDIWNKCLDEIANKVTKSNYDTLFARIQPYSIEGHVLTIEVPSKYFMETIEHNFLGIMQDVLVRVIGEDVKMQYLITSFKDNAAFQAEQVNIERRPQILGGYSKAETTFNPFIQTRQPINDPQLSADYTFENFIAGDCNKFARAIAMEVAKKPGGAYNPLFIHGQSGVGKTHLIQAIGAEVKRLDYDKNVIYLSADRFMRQFVDARRENQISGFMAFYQMVDVLIVDDIQDLTGREATAGAFFQIFNYLIQSRKQVVIAADKRPNEIVGLEDRMLSRFKAGIIAEVTRPDYETRVRIIQSKLAKDGIVLLPEIVSYVAENLQNNVRELEGCILALMARATVTHSEITMEVARSVVDSIVSTTKSVITLDKIAETVAAHFKVSVEDMRTKSRKSDIVTARQIALYFAKNMTDNSLSTIGKQIANRDHSTVLYSVKTIQDKMSMDKDKVFVNLMKQIELEIKS